MDNRFNISLVSDFYLNNKLFDLSDKLANRDDCLYGMWLLKKTFNEKAVDISTFDINKPEESKAVLCFDLPNKDVKLKNEFLYLVLFESEVIKPSGWRFSEHRKFRKVFTWNDDLVDGIKYFKINFPLKFPTNRHSYKKEQKQFHEKKLCVLIAGNKKVKHELELYTEREKTIRWFEKNAIEEFDFYGVGWNKRTSSNRFLRYFFRRFNIIDKLSPPKYPSYKGAVENKKETFSNYRFAICYENAKEISGYITEKIFDCFFSGCIPIYWGAPNITDHIPENCFIDRRAFNSHEDLYEYIKRMDESEYMRIKKNIEDYLFSDRANPYRAEFFADSIVKEILNDC